MKIIKDEIATLQKEQRTVTFTVTVDRIKQDALVAAIKAAGGKVKK